MDPITAKLMSAAGGAAADRIYAEDVFSTFLYDGTGSTAQTINNGIDLSGEGGMVWIKDRDATNSHAIYDTERGVQKLLKPDVDHAEDSSSSGTTDLYQFNNNGFAIGSDNAAYLNTNGNSHCSWTFRKCPGFFDIVTYTGNGTYGHDISHNLGSVPGSIWVKRLDSASHWTVYHRGIDSSTPENYRIYLEETGARIDNDWLTDTAPTATQFRLGSDSAGNANGGSYVAYLFAHDDQSFGDNGDEAIIKCGSYTGSGSTGKTVSLGFEPQWVLVKSTDQTRPWVIVDYMRGMPQDGNGFRLLADQSAPEVSNASFLARTPTGFEVTKQNTYVNTSGENYIYIAIRRPHKTPEDAADVFQPDLKSSNQTITTNFPVDLCVAHYTGGGSPYWIDRMRGIFTNGTTPVQKYLNSSSRTSEGSDSGSLGVKNFNSTGYEHSLGNFEQSTLAFKRATGFFDIVAYTGNGVTGRNITHNLGVAPDLMIVKNRDDSGDHWHTYVSGITEYSVYGSNPSNNNPPRLYLEDTDNAIFSAGGSWDHTHPTATTFTVGDTSGTNGSGNNLIAYLFASLDGISKVGSYTGNGGTKDIDCGFTNGARFVLIKRVDSSDQWHLFTTALGIVSGNEGYLFLNTTDSKNSKDLIDPLNSGFQLVSSDAGINASGGSYIFFAIA